MQNAGIILQGQAPQPVNALAQGAMVGQQVNDINRTNEMRAMMQQNGAGILAGDRNALNALAAFDPAAAQGIETGRLNQDATRLGMDATRQQMDQRSQQMRLELENHFAGKTAAEAQAEAAAEEQQFRILLGAQTPEQWDALAIQQDAPELVGQFGNREALANQYREIGDIVEDMFATPDAPTPQTQIAKLQADLQAGLITPDQYELALQNMAPSRMSLSVGPDGAINLEEGPAGARSGGAPSERQSTLALFGGLMDETMPALAALEADPSFNPAGLREGVAARTGMVGNYLQSEKGQQYEALKRQWAEGVLRIQTGAAATEPEIQRVLETYFPMPGDTPETVAQKVQQRDAFARSLVRASGGTIAAPGGADQRGAIGDPAPASVGADGPDFATMSVEEIEAWLAANGG